MTHVLLEKKGHVAVATVNRPQALNALNSEVLNDLQALNNTSFTDEELQKIDRICGL